MIGVYEHFLDNPNLPSGCYNAGFEHISILEIAERINKKIPSEIDIRESNDNRSYRQNSDKLVSTGFSPKYQISDAIDEITLKYKNGILEDKFEFYNMKVMKKIINEI